MVNYKSSGLSCIACLALILLTLAQLTWSIEYVYRRTHPPTEPTTKKITTTTTTELPTTTEFEHVYKHAHITVEFPVVVPATERHTATIIFLHGHGQRGVDWAELLKKIHQPYMRIVCPYANITPVAFHQGQEMTSWYDIPATRYAEAKYDSEGMNESTRFVHFLIKKEIRRGIPSQRIFIGGYGQGGALAIHAGLSFPQRLGGILTMMTFIPMARSFKEDFNKVNENIPILNTHLYKAPFLKHDAGYDAFDLLWQVSNKTDFRFHTGRKRIMDRQLLDVKDYCNKYIPRI